VQQYFLKLNILVTSYLFAENRNDIWHFLRCAKQTFEKGLQEGRKLNASPFLVSQEVLIHCDKPSFQARAIYCLSQAHDVIMQQLTSISWKRPTRPEYLKTIARISFLLSLFIWRRWHPVEATPINMTVFCSRRRQSLFKALNNWRLQLSVVYDWLTALTSNRNGADCLLFWLYHNLKMALISYSNCFRYIFFSLFDNIIIRTKTCRLKFIGI